MATPRSLWGSKLARFLALVGAVCVALALTGTASAHCKKHRPPKGNPSIQQYVEQIPTACGSAASGARGGSGSNGAAWTSRHLGSTAAAQKLRKAQAAVGRGAPQGRRGVESLSSTSGSHGALSASVGAVGGRFLAIILIGLGVALGTVFVRRRLGRR